MTITIRELNDISEVADFALFDGENDGEVVVAELNGVVAGFCQYDGFTVNFIESAIEGQGVARALLDWVEADTADNVGKECEGFWAAMGFAYSHRNEYGKPVWVKE